MSKDARTALENLFHSIDAEQSGYLNKRQLFQFCRGISLTDDEFETIFAELDSDRDDRISLEDFVRGFSNSSSLLTDSAGDVETGCDVTSAAAVRSSTRNDVSSCRDGDVVDGVASTASRADDDAAPSQRLRQPSICWPGFIDEMGSDFYILPPERQVALTSYMCF